jgi:hypothetical protein
MKLKCVNTVVVDFSTGEIINKNLLPVHSWELNDERVAGISQSKANKAAINVLNEWEPIVKDYCIKGEVLAWYNNLTRMLRKLK